MAGLCEGDNESTGSLKANKVNIISDVERGLSQADAGRRHSLGKPAVSNSIQSTWQERIGHQPIGDKVAAIATDRVDWNKLMGFLKKIDVD
ncbi:hypothetical protein ANN_12680 [Periplaneta americana]|uniref:Uncharacterized protein n=1 Tax=Periplaneta americana TaxID=6978 RepID=A0ABQ8THU2_PERAM|nr:hypothetical protein ANN_12680 [Periplaneta americana]